ncbi:hypothetical protein MAUB_21100 [Mycolicibacterium aubagnense]|uniref:Integrase SAM-like N-terminal domain-containing protein n=1 Tax=Mycolicibacterium aubagnense TaxID=319707 RepID=A0ABM7IC25_9MYCO|nr:hypothetical protein MAUB_21100 [Mycolicibacterium aubagnense]
MISVRAGRGDRAGAGALLTMAAVQRMCFADRPPTYTVVGVDKLPVAPAREYLAFLRDQGASPNTVRAYAYGLAAWWTVLEHTGTAWDDFPASLFGTFLTYMRRGDLPGVARIGEPETIRAESTLGPRSAAVLAMYRYFADAHDLERPYRRLYSTHARSSRRGRYAPFLAGVGPHPDQRAVVSAAGGATFRDAGAAARAGQRDPGCVQRANGHRRMVAGPGGAAGPVLFRVAR